MQFGLTQLVHKIFLLLILVMGCYGNPQFQGLFSTGIYTFSRSNGQDSTLFHSRLHQSISMNARDLFLKGSQLRTSGIFYTDPFNSFSNDPGFNIYTLSYQTEWFDRQVSVNLGRQFVYGITTSKRMDGVTATLKKNAFFVKLFAGGYLPGLGTAYSPIADHLLGADLTWKLRPGLRLGLGLSQLGRDRTSYEVVGSRRKEISVTSSALQRFGYQLDWRSKRLSTYIRGRNDLFNFQLQDLRTRITYHGDRVKLLSFEYSHREPQVLDNSIFSVFGGSASQEYRGQATILIHANMTGYIRLRHIQFEGDQSDMASLGIGYKALRLDLRHQTGYGGTYNHAVISANQSIGRGRLYGKLNLGNFKLLEGRSQDLATILLGVHLPLIKKFQMNVEAQVLRNKFYLYDSRVYLGLRYRL